jgi:hypothetical protein
MSAALLPRPKKMRRLPGRFRLPDPFVLPSVRGKLGSLAWDLELLGKALRSGPRIRCRRGGREPDLLLDCGDSAEAEGYTLGIRKTGIRITAPGPTGLRMGIRTLAQIVEQARSPGLPCLHIDDEPALPFRAIKIDMKNIRPTLAYWEWLFDLLAAMKVNVVVLEYEDKFPFSKKLGVAGDDAYTRGEIRKIVSMARVRGMVPVPLQQCFGHLQYVMKHPQYARLREGGVHIGQPCPLVPASGRLIRRLLDEVADLHPDVPWFHMGGDEVKLAVCPKCAKKAKRHSVSRIYMDFVEPQADRIIRRGYRPMLWADLFIRHYEENRRMAGKVTLVDWNYGATEKSKSAYFWRQYREMTPEEFHRRYDETKHRNEFRRFFPKPGGGRVDPLYTSRYLQARGYQVVGAPDSSVGHGTWLPGLAGRLANIVCHGRSAAAKGMPGIMTTHWACSIHWESVLPGFAAGAAYTWNPGVALGQFKRDFSKVFWGLGDGAVLEAFEDATVGIPLFGSYKGFTGPYDGMLGARDMHLWLKELLSRMPPADAAGEAEACRRAASRLRRTVSRAVPRAARNRRSLEYVGLAAEVEELRAEQAGLLLKTVRGRPASRRAWSRMDRKARLLKERTKSLLKRTLGSKSMSRFLAIQFDGEDELPEMARPDRIFQVLGR